MEIPPTRPIAQTNVDTMGVMQNAQRALEQSTWIEPSELLSIVFSDLDNDLFVCDLACCSKTFSMRKVVVYRNEGNVGVKILY